MLSAPAVAEGPNGMAGNGTEGDPYEITNATQLQAMEEDLSANYTLVADVDASDTAPWNDGEEFEPIGNGSDRFEGTFDGSGHTISNLTIHRPTTDRVGLFGAVGETELSNLTLENVDVSGDSWVGGLVGSSGIDGTISNVTVSGVVTGDGNVGLVTGQNGGRVESVAASGTVTGSGTFVGGLVGEQTGGLVTDSTAAVDVTGENRRVGGAIGSWNGEISNVTASGTVTVSETEHTDSHGLGRVGGLIGHASGETLADVHATGDVNAPDADDVGGLVGYADVTIENSTASGDVSGSGSVGGLVGRAGTVVVNASATGAVDGTQSVGGLIGQSDESISDANASGTVTGVQFVGGLIGSNLGAIVDSHATGFVTADVFGGGLAGTNGAAVERSSASGDVSGNDTLGGLVGINQGTITESTASGTVAGEDYVGGLLGQNIGVVTDAHATGDVTGDANVGGLVGQNLGGEIGGPDGTFDVPGELSVVFATGVVDGDDAATTGGLIGNDSEGDVSSAYWNVDASTDLDADDGVGTGSQADVTGLAADELRGGTARASMDGFAFGETWVTVADDSPVLLWTPDAPEPASFDVSLASAPDGYAGEDLAVTVDVTSSGEEVDVPKTISFEMLNESGERVASRNESVTLDPGETETITFEWTVPADFDTQTLYLSAASPDDEASATVDVNGFETLLGTVTDGATGKALSGVNVTVDGGEATQTVETDASGEYEATALNDREATVSATTTVDGVQETVEITGSGATTVDGATTLDLELWPELERDGEGGPYEIRNAHELQAMGQHPSADFVLVSDVDASETATWNDEDDGPLGFEPLGTGTEFTGSIDGNDATIEGLTVDRPWLNNVGLVGDGSDVTITDLHLRNVSIYGGGNAGAVVSNSYGDTIVRNVSVTGEVDGDGGDAGAIAGLTYSGFELSDSWANASVGGTSRYAGGLVAFNRGTIERSYATGSATGSSNAGGIAGTSRGTIVDSHATATIDGDSAGGLVGELTGGEILRSYAAGEFVSGGGGLVGEITNDPVVTDSYWDTATSTTSAGGATGLTTDQMTGANATADDNVDGLDYDATWLALDDEYPVLGWQVSSYDLSLADEIDVGDSTEATVAITLFDGTETTATITSNYTAGGNVSVDGVTVIGERYGPGTVTAMGGGLSDSASIIALDSDFQVRFDDPPASVNADETVPFEATVENVGNAEGAVTVVLAFDGDEFVDRQVTVAAGANETVSGTYTVPADADTDTADLNATTPDDETTAAVQVNGYQTLSGTLTDGVSGEALSGVDVTVDGAVVDTTNVNGEYEGQVHDRQAVTVLATTTVTDPVDDPEITNKTTVTIDGATTANLTLRPELAGEGTEASPYQIGNAYELQAMNQDLDANYTLVSDVNASETAEWNDGDGFDPVGDYGDDGDQFSGSFDGDGHEIDGLTIDRGDETEVGLFGYSEGDVSDLTLTDVDVTGQDAVGGVAASIYDNGSVRNVSVTGTVSGVDNVGLLLGDIIESTVVDSSASGTVTGTGDSVGGLIGYDHASDVMNATAGGTVDGDVYVGGLIGWSTTNMDESGVIESSTSTADVVANESGGGLVGWTDASNVTDSAASGTVTVADNTAGGLVGRSDGHVTDSSATGDVNGSGDVGGLIGSAEGAVTNATAGGNVTGSQNVGGLVGALAGDLSSSFATGSAAGDQAVGAIVGNNSGLVDDVYWDVNESARDAAVGDDDGTLENATALTTDELTGADATTHADALAFDSTWTSTDEYPVLVSHVNGLSLAVESTDLEPDGATGATVTLTLVDGSTVTATETAAYESDDASVATAVNGTVTGADDGTATITAELAGRTSSTVVDVRSASSRNDGTSGGGIGGPPTTGDDPTVTVVDVSVDTANPAVGETISTTVTVENEGEEAATYDGTLTLEGEPVAEDSITVEGGETASYTVTHTFDEPGGYTFSAGGEAVTILVSDHDDVEGDGDADDGDGDGTGESGEETDDGDETGADSGATGDGDSLPGFGALAALLAIVGGSLLARRRA